MFYRVHFKYSFLIVFTIFNSSCIYHIALKALPSNDQAIRYVKGAENCYSPGHISVAISANPSVYRSIDKNLSFFIIAFNNSKDLVNFSTENIFASNSGYSLKVFTYEELIVEAESERRSKVFSAKLAGVAQSLNASYLGNEYHRGTYMDYSGNLHGFYSGHTYKPSKVAKELSAIQTQTEQKLSNINSAFNQEKYYINNCILRKHTLLPEQYHYGYIKIQRPRYIDRSIIITVIIKNEEHKFIYNQNIIDSSSCLCIGF